MTQWSRLTGLGTASLLVLLATAACGGADPGPTVPGTYAVKADLCAEADLAPLKELLPSVSDLHHRTMIEDGETLNICDGVAARSTADADAGVMQVRASIFTAPAEAATEFKLLKSRADQPTAISGLGQEAYSTSTVLGFDVWVLDGNLVLRVAWGALTGDGGADDDDVREALTETARATMAKLRTD